MKRRGFMKALAITPAVPALIAQQAAPLAVTPPAVPAGRGGGGRGGGGRGAQEVAHIDLVEVDEAAETTAHFFTAQQFATLRKLSGILVPPVKGSVGALDTDAPEFLDFLISVSPTDRQVLYRNGLDSLNSQARTRFGKPFSALEDAQADAILKPLMVPVAWAYDPPKDPLKHFIFAAHQDIRTAARNSPHATAGGAVAGRRGGGGFGGGQYWNPIDPV